ncbi:phospholipase-like protein [Tanacetum coccineum]
MLIAQHGRQMLLVGGETENVPLYYHMYDNFQIQFGREEFCLVTGLKFGVEYSDDYDDKDKPIPFRRRVFPSRLDGKRITGKDVEDLIDSNSFKKLDDDDAVSLCCIGILQLVLLGLEDRRPVHNWILRLANDRDGWDAYPWGSYVWPTLYYSLKDANVKRWLPLYATESTTEDDKKTYSLLGFTWAFKTWILEVFRLRQNEYYTRHLCYPRIVAWTSNKKFYRPMLHDFLHGRVPAERLIPDEVEAGSVPSDIYRDFQEQRSGLDQMMKQGQNIFEQMKKYMEELNVDTRANREPIIADQHYGISDLSGFQSIQSSTNNSIFNMGMPINWQTSMPSHPGSSNWQSQMPAYTPTPNWQPPIPSHPGDAGLCDPNDNLSPLNLGNAFTHDNVGGDDVLIMGIHDTGIYFTYENVDPNKVTRQEYNDFTDFILNPYQVYLDCYMMGYLVPEFFWRQLVPHLCMPRSHSVDNPYNEGWLSGDQMNSWIEILIRSRPQDADWTVSKSGTACVHPENNRFLIQTDPHIIGMLDGSTRPYPSWKNVNWVYMPINVSGNHWGSSSLGLAAQTASSKGHENATAENGRYIRYGLMIMGDISEDSKDNKGPNNQAHSTTNPTAALAEVIGLAEKGENKNHSRIYVPGFFLYVTNDQALVLLQVDMTEVRIECTVKHTALRMVAAAKNGKRGYTPEPGTSSVLGGFSRVYLTLIQGTSTPTTPVQLTTGQQRAEDTRKTPAEGYQATKEDIIPDESKEEKEKQEKE